MRSVIKLLELSLYFSFFFRFVIILCCFICCTRTTALPTAQSRSQPQHVSRRWLELGQRWSIAGAVVWEGGKQTRERERESGWWARAHCFVSVRTFVQFVCSLALAVVLFWVALRLCCCCSFFFAAAAAPKCNKRHQGYTLPQRCRRRSCCSCSCSAHWFRLQFINTLIRFHLLLVHSPYFTRCFCCCCCCYWETRTMNHCYINCLLTQLKTPIDTMVVSLSSILLVPLSLSLLRLLWV